MTLSVVVLDDYEGYAQHDVDWSPLEGIATVRCHGDRADEVDTLCARLAGAQVAVLMRERTQLPAAVLERLPELRLLVTTGSRNAAVDVSAARRLGITVCGTRGISSGTVELTIGLLLALARSIPRLSRALSDGVWSSSLGVDLRDSTLGLVGVGRVGSGVAAAAAALGMEVIAWSQNLTAERARAASARRVGKPELFATSDFVSMHMTLSERTRGLVGRSDLTSMKSSSYLINTSRGPLIDALALAELLAAGSIAGAALDVFDIEPLPAENPFRLLENVILTPHQGYVTRRTFELFYGDVVEDIAAFATGKPVRVIEAQDPGWVEDAGAMPAGARGAVDGP